MRMPLVAPLVCLLAFASVPVFPQNEGAEDEEEQVDDSTVPEIRFAGTETVSVSRLRQAASRELGLIESGTGSPADLADAAYVMESYIREQGYSDAEVSFRMIDMSPEGEQQLIRSSAEWDRVDLVEFVVREGRRTILGEVSFPGASAFEEDYLRDFVPRGGLFSGATVYRQRDIQEVISNIESLYVLNGYANAEIGPPSINVREEADRILYDVTIPVREGVRFRIREIIIDAPGIDGDVIRDIRNSIRLLGEPYFPRQAAIGANAIRNELGNRGYRAEVEYSVDLGEEGAVALRYAVDPGNRLVLNQIIVRDEGEDEGTLRTRKGFIRSLFSFGPGDILDLGQLDRIEAELYGLGLFSYIDMAVEPIGEPQNPRPANVIVTLQETNSRYIEVAGGWGSYELLRGALTYTDRNLFGVGRLWSTSVQASFRSYGAEMLVSDRILFGPASTVTLNGTYNFRAEPSFERTTAEAGLSFVYRFTPRWSSRASYRYTYSLARAVEAEVEGEEETALTTGRIGLGADYDSRDSLLLPSTGTTFSLSSFLSTPVLGSEIGFTGIEGAVATYYPVFSGLVLSFYSRYRTRIILDDRETLPIQERLFLGGEFSVRSFGQDELGPTTVNDVPLGGLTTLQTTTEARIRIAGSLHTALFYDIGMVSPDSWSVFGEYGHAVGIGLRYYLPIGPIRLDAAYNPGPLYAADSRWAVHFAVGFSF